MQRGQTRIIPGPSKLGNTAIAGILQQGNGTAPVAQGKIHWRKAGGRLRQSRALDGRQHAARLFLASGKGQRIGQGCVVCGASSKAFQP